jgi:hypothetical protein
VKRNIVGRFGKCFFAQADQERTLNTGAAANYRFQDE